MISKVIIVKSWEPAWDEDLKEQPLPLCEQSLSFSSFTIRSAESGSKFQASCGYNDVYPDCDLLVYVKTGSEDMQLINRVNSTQATNKDNIFSLSVPLEV